MSRRPGRELEQLPHHVYVHLDRALDVIYVGRTVHPDGRPWDDKKRSWIKTESVEVRVSPAMPFDAAAWVEDQMILSAQPKHNARRGQHVEPDPRIERICELTGMTRADARWYAPYLPTDPAELEAELSRRTA